MGEEKEKKEPRYFCGHTGETVEGPEAEPGCSHCDADTGRCTDLQELSSDGRGSGAGRTGSGRAVRFRETSALGSAESAFGRSPRPGEVSWPLGRSWSAERHARLKSEEAAEPGEQEEQKPPETGLRVPVGGFDFAAEPSGVLELDVPGEGQALAAAEPAFSLGDGFSDGLELHEPGPAELTPEELEHCGHMVEQPLHEPLLDLDPGFAGLDAAVSFGPPLLGPLAADSLDLAGNFPDPFLPDEEPF